MIKKILKKIIAHDYKFIMANQKPEEYTKKMIRVAKRYNKMRPIYDGICYRIEKRIALKKFLSLLKSPSQMASSTIIGTHINKRWEKQGMKNPYEFKNTKINRVLNHANFF